MRLFRRNGQYFRTIVPLSFFGSDMYARHDFMCELRETFIYSNIQHIPDTIHGKFLLDVNIHKVEKKAFANHMNNYIRNLRIRIDI